MLWFLFASLTACFEALKDATGKQSLRTLDEYSVLLGDFAFGETGLRERFLGAAIMVFGVALMALS